MKITPASVIVPTYSICDLSKNAAGKRKNQNFHVSNIDEYAADDSMLNTPLRLDHFSIGLFIQGGGNILYNMNTYKLNRNSLFILTPNKYITLEGHNADTKMLIISFTQDFLIESG